ncbi:MAG: GTPase ObgE [Clostridia bacterium]|nr:GTPase ObgE [Clostridia bacterium]
MFFDRAKIFVKAGSGGNGCSAFRREKYVPDGGPWGGDGGRGGNIVLVADEGLRTLVDFRYHNHYKAQRGQHGMGKNRHGHYGDSLYLKVPVGTIIMDDESGRKIADLTRHGQELVVAHGGRGGRGNARFATLANPAPSLAENGEPGEERWLRMELKLLADAGLIGMPNAGKSTIIAHVSSARPKIADYPFTTLVPNLGMVRVDEEDSFVLADIPGLIEGASQGQGLGHDFLRHTERTRVLVHVVDMAALDGSDPAANFAIIQKELALYDPKLAVRPLLIAANKMDLPGAEENLRTFREEITAYPIYPISAVSGLGLRELVYKIRDLLAEVKIEAPEEAEPEEEEVIYQAEPRFTISREGSYFVVGGKEIERHLAMTNLNNEEGVERLQWIMKKMGIDRALANRGAKHGDEVRIKDFIFEYVDDF